MAVLGNFGLAVFVLVRIEIRVILMAGLQTWLRPRILDANSRDLAMTLSA